MNAKKIMGAVLVALLAAALFVGAGAADETAAGTVFLYQAAPISGIATGVYSYGDASVEVGTTGVLPLNIEKFVDGAKYSNGTHYIVVKLPNAGITAVGGTGDAVYDAMANGLVAGQQIEITATPVVNAPNVAVAAIIIYDEDGIPTKYPADSFTDGKLVLSGDDALGKGIYQIQAILDKNSAFVGTVEGGQLYGQKYTLTVYSTEPSLTVSADSVIMGNYITATITGKPGDSYYLDAEGFEFYAANQLSSAVTGTEGEDFALVNMPNSGKVVVYLKAGYDDGKQTLTLYAGNAAAGDKKATANVKIEKGVITAVADEDSYFVGNPVGLSGTTTAGSKLFFYIEGTNFAFTQLLGTDFSEAVEVENGKWTVELNSALIDSDAGKKLIAGTYTVVVATQNATELGWGADVMKDKVMDGVYGTAAITLTQPFLTGIEAADTAIQESKYKITGTAYSADFVRIYIFGTNYFFADEEPTDDEVFEFELSGDQTKEMAPGTYFYLIQHPMSDKKFNVWNGSGNANTALVIDEEVHPANFYYAATGAAQETFAFNAWTRGTNYAAQALLEEIAGQNIDDIFVQGTFEVAAQKLTINPIPAEVVKGTALTVSGTSNSGEGVEVIVNVLAGEFGATVKGDENSATFLTAKAVTKEDGTFEAAIDTSKLAVGSYIVTVEIANIMYDSAAVSIVDKAPVTPPADDKPDTPVTPPADDKPTEPETPGFGALAALAGLGAVAVLLLRRE